ncbi:hypothetical protein ACGC1H_004112 [Rhizoctonia solani]|uniref:GH18 domain-containing protein n=1 Tax=Rhizoctonia solani TaxID=456999 RepID=A0A8H3C5C2_9AGAM|nr:unnamed protein product [Rhizoctonia solani]
MLSSALLSLGVAGSALAWPNLGHSSHSSIARAVQSRQETTAPATPAKAKEPVAATWFASWHANDFPLANVSWNKYTTVSYSFAETTPNISFVNISDPEVFKDFVSTAHANNVSATISIGGWTGSQYFSSAVATAENRTEFVKTMVSLLKDNDLDGLSFDWEYPNAEGIGCNLKSPNDTENFLLFLKELRTSLPNATLSAAASITPFISADDTPSTNVSEFATVFDYLQIMNYDVWGPWSDTTGPNAPLNDTCAVDPAQKVGSAVSAVEAWTKAGFPLDQLVLGVAAYGHGFSVAPADALNNTILNPYSVFNKSFTPPGDAWSDTSANGTLDVCGNPQAADGSYTFWGLIEGGFLNENGTANTAQGIVYKYDECSQTPFVYNQTSGVLVGFDNAASFAAKGQFINTTGLRGFAMWETGGDYDDILLDAIRSGAGFPEVSEDGDDCEDDETGATTPETGNSSNTPGNTSSNPSNNASNSSSNNPSNTSSSNTSSPPSNNSSSSSSSNNSSSDGNTSGSNSGSSSNTSNTSSSNNSGSNNTGSNNTGSSSTTPSCSNDDDDCNGGSEPTTTTSSQPTTTPATSDDDEECEDDEDSEPAITTTAQTTSFAAPTPTAPTTLSTSAAQPVTTPEASLPEEDDDECEDDEPVTETTSGTVVTSTGTASAASTVLFVTSVSASSTSAPVMETASSAEPTASKSYEPSSYEPSSSYEPTSSYEPSSTYQPSSTSVTVEPTTSVYSSSSAEPTLSNITISTEPTSVVVFSSAAPVTSSEPASTSALPTTTSGSYSPSAPTISAPIPTF